MAMLYCNNKCTISLMIFQVLDAAHIFSHSESGINQQSNGILLRTDIHNLFDKHLIKINLFSCAIEVSETF